MSLSVTIVVRMVQCPDIAPVQRAPLSGEKEQKQAEDVPSRQRAGWKVAHKCALSLTAQHRCLRGFGMAWLSRYHPPGDPESWAGHTVSPEPLCPGLPERAVQRVILCCAHAVPSARASPSLPLIIPSPLGNSAPFLVPTQGPPPLPCICFAKTRAGGAKGGGVLGRPCRGCVCASIARAGLLWSQQPERPREASLVAVERPLLPPTVECRAGTLGEVVITVGTGWGTGKLRSAFWRAQIFWKGIYAYV